MTAVGREQRIDRRIAFILIDAEAPPARNLALDKVKSNDQTYHRAPIEPWRGREEHR